MDGLADREGLVWIAGLRGLGAIHSLDFSTFRQPHGLLETEVSALYEIAPGRLLAGHNTGLTLFSPDATSRRIPFSNTDRTIWHDCRVMDISPDGEGGAWLAIVSKGLAHFLPDGSLQSFRPSRGAPRAAQFHSVLPLGNGAILAGTDRGLLLLKGGAYHSVPGGADNQLVRKILRLPDGRIMLAIAFQGMKEFRDGRIRDLSPDTLTSHTNLYTLWCDSRGTLWAGSSRGLLIWNGSALVHPPSHALWFNAPIYALRSDHAGNLWMGTDRGVFRWDGARVDSFTPHDGLAGWEANRAALLEDSSGRMWIGTDNGLSCWYPLIRKNLLPPPRLFIESIESCSQPVGGDSIQLRHDQNNVLIRFRLQSFRTGEDLYVRYFLEGLEQNWSPPLPANSEIIRYANLPPGVYRLHIKAGGKNRPWSPEILSQVIQIEKPYWSSPWLLWPLSVLLVLLLAWASRIVLQWRKKASLYNEFESHTTPFELPPPLVTRLFHDSSTPMILQAVEDRRILESNRAADDLLGGPVRSLAGGFFSRVPGEEWASLVQAVLKQGSASAQGIPLLDGHGNLQATLDIRAASVRFAGTQAVLLALNVPSPPCQPSEAPCPQSSAHPTPQNGRLVQNPPRVLAVSANPLISSQLKDCLQNMGVPFSLAPGRQEALDLFQQTLLNGQPFQLVLQDLAMETSLDAPPLLREFRRIVPDVRTVAIGRERTARLATSLQEEGFLSILTLPLDADELKRILNANSDSGSGGL